MNQIRYINNTKIINNMVLKEKTEDLKELFDYLNRKELNIYPKIVMEDNKYYYFDNYFNNNEVDLRDIAKTIALLHKNTSEYKKVSKKKYLNIYDKINNNLDYLIYEYDNIIKRIDKEEYPSPSNYYLSKNYSLIYYLLNESKRDLNKWYNLVKDGEKDRISLINNDLSIKNISYKDNVIISSWNNRSKDSPVLDLYKLYRNDKSNIDFQILLEEYNNNFSLTKEEKLILKVLLSNIELYKREEDEMANLNNIKSIINDIKNINSLIKSGVFN